MKLKSLTLPPGEFLKEELDTRNWSQADFAKIIGKSSQLVSEVVNAKRKVTPETAQAFGLAFGTSAQLWLNLEATWQLYLLDSC